MSVSDRKEPAAREVQDSCGSCLYLFNCAFGVGMGKQENVTFPLKGKLPKPKSGFYFVSSGELQKIFNKEDKMRLTHS